jgi:hypothetical protein
MDGAPGEKLIGGPWSRKFGGDFEAEIGKSGVHF